MNMAPTKAEREAQAAQEQADAAAADAAADVSTDPGEGSKIRVPAEAGDRIVLSKGGEVVREFSARDGIITAKDDDDRALLLASVPGAELVD